MSKFALYLKLSLCTSILFSSTAMAYIAVPPSLFQEEENNFYVTIGGGIGWERGNDWGGANGFPAPPAPNDDTSTVGVGNAAIGYGFEDYPFRIEVAYNFVGQAKFHWDKAIEPIDHFAVATSANTETYTNLGMVNFYGDLPITDNWIPYIKVGAGFGVNSTKLTYSAEVTGVPYEIEYTSDREHTNNFVWNAGVGLNYAFSETWSLGVDVSYMGLGKAKVAAHEPVTDSDIEVAELQDLSAIVATLNLGLHF